MAVVWGIAAAAIGMGVSGLLKGRQRTVGGVGGWARRLAALATSVFAVAFAAGAIGAMAQGDNNPKLVVLVLGTAAAAWLLWRKPERHMGVAGHWLAGAWLVYCAAISGHGPIAGVFTALGMLALFTAGVGTVSGEGPPTGST